jgi:glycosyltransferase involved in cell wall biosynthesis
VLRIAFDARRLQDAPLGGVGRIIENLVPRLAPEAEMTLLFDRRRPAPEVPGCERVLLSGLGRLPETAWLQVSVPRWLRGRGCIFHGIYNGVPVAGSSPSVVTLHDLAWEHHGEDYRSSSMHRVIRAQARWAARHARVIITDSEFVRAGIVDTYRVDPARVLVAPIGVDPLFSPTRAAAAPGVLKPFGVNGPYVVAIGGARRRGLPVAVEAWRTATRGRPERPPLVVVGAEAPPEEPGVVHAGRLDDGDWAAVLAGATAFCYPTRYEGFGMPALEAAASGVPVVCAPVGPLPEVLGDAAEWAATPQAPDMADALARLLADEERRADFRSAGLKRAAEAPTWSDSARVHLEAYAKAAG